MQLYERNISARGKVTYRPYNETPPRVDLEIDNLQVNTLTATIAICWLEAMHRQLENINKGSALARRVKGVEEAISGLARLSSCQMDEQMVDAGTKAWTAALQMLQQELAVCRGGSA